MEILAYMSEHMKYFAKLAFRHARLVLLALSFTPPNKTDWQSRMLLINLGAIGDLVVFTSVLKKYKQAFPDKKIFLLISGFNGFRTELFASYVDEIILINPKEFA